ncbi:TPA: hypothetical protein P0E23_000098 [Vibrio harveyi]|jgi:hypothetical protein|uniref:hypothetical protein n=1 Tax=Vibrio TaxID=662 RepID=UPI00042478C8|nr:MULTISPECIES: hypothetical protein [Vibrio]EHK2889337.1 hypothetical protein [Vibrio parahaemolyticus]MDA0124451.1 hypothetical protein [Vibrio sp. MM46]HDM8167520.1 hypothetical protein [Vibrio harveyi]HDZ3732819.1 hypothetical protein [Vibrio harveyi]
METLAEFDIALAQRLNIITPNFLAHASPKFVNYWLEVQKEIEQRSTLYNAEDSHEHHR